MLALFETNNNKTPSVAFTEKNIEKKTAVTNKTKYLKNVKYGYYC